MSEGHAPARSSWVLQGCLFGSVALFVVLLLIMIFLAFQRFREQTAEPGLDTAGDVAAPAGNAKQMTAFDPFAPSGDERRWSALRS